MDTTLDPEIHAFIRDWRSGVLETMRIVYNSPTRLFEGLKIGAQSVKTTYSIWCCGLEIVRLWYYMPEKVGDYPLEQAWEICGAYLKMRANGEKNPELRLVKVPDTFENFSTPWITYISKARQIYASHILSSTMLLETVYRK